MEKQENSKLLQSITEKINSLMITNAEKLKNNHEFMAIVKTFDLYKDKVCPTY